jgi:integrase
MDRQRGRALGRRFVDQIKRLDVNRLHRELSATPYVANACLRLIKALWNWGVAQAMIDESLPNPTTTIELYEEKPRKRYLAADELARLYRAIHELVAEGAISWAAAMAIELLLRTGARLGEVLTFRWEHVDLPRRCLRLPDSKTGAKIITLDPFTADLIHSIVPADANPYVIVGQRPGEHLTNLKRAWRRAGLREVRIHDLRHTYGSHGTAIVGKDAVGKQLGHLRSATTDRYDHAIPAHQRIAVDRIGAALDKVLRGAPTDGGEHVELQLGV